MLAVDGGMTGGMLTWLITDDTSSPNEQMAEIITKWNIWLKFWWISSKNISLIFAQCGIVTIYVEMGSMALVLISWELPNLLGTVNIDRRMFTSLDLVLCNMRASQLFLRYSRADTFSITSGEVRRMLLKFLFATFCPDSWKGLNMLMDFWVPTLRVVVPWAYLSSKERSHAPNRCCQLHCPWPASHWNCTCISLHGRVQAVCWVEQRRQLPV